MGDTLDAVPQNHGSKGGINEKACNSAGKGGYREAPGRLALSRVLFLLFADINSSALDFKALTVGELYIACAVEVVV